MNHRGDYRAVYSVIVDSDEYKALSKDGKLLFWGLKHSLGLSGIDVLFDDQLAERAGLTMAELPAARQELVAGGWLEVEGRVHWLRNGLRFEPNVSVAHAKQRAGIERHLRGLPKGLIANRMAAYYGITPPFPDTLPEGSTKSIERVPEGSAKGPEAGEPLTLAVDGEGEPEPEREAVRARAGSASPHVNGGNPERHPLDAFVPTEAHQALARELGYPIAELLTDWRLHRKANGITPADPVADFELWIRREPDFANGNGAGAGHADPPPRATPAVYVPPDEPPPDPALAAAGRELVRQAVAATAMPERKPLPGPVPKPPPRDPLPREQQLAIARGEIKPPEEP